MSTLQDLIDVVARLRAPDGCPWDREQTPATVRSYVLEEAHEVVQALDEGDDDALAEELGDLLFNVVLLAQMAAERGAFTMDDVTASITSKMIRRHPHVFAGEDADRATIAANWERIKATEKGSAEPRSALDGVPAALPALLRAQKIGKKAARIGFDWPDASGPRDKIDEELAELDDALARSDADAVEDELGDVLFSVVNLARHTVGPGGRPVVAEHALRRTTSKFEARFRRVEALAAQAGIDVHSADLQTLDALWDQAKRALEEAP